MSKTFLTTIALLSVASAAWAWTHGVLYPGYANMPVYRTTVTVTNLPVADQTLVINSGTYTWKASAGANDEVTIGSDISDSTTNLFTVLTNNAPTGATATLSTTNAVLLTGDPDVALTVTPDNAYGFETIESTNTYDGIVSLQIAGKVRAIELENLSTNRVYIQLGGTNLLEATTTISLDASGGNNDTRRLERVGGWKLYLLGTGVNSNKVVYGLEE